MNEVIQTIYKRRSVRKYLNKPVSKEIIVELLKAAMAAPSATNCQALEFLVLSDQTILNQIRQKLIFAKYNAPISIVVIGNPGKANNSSGKRFWQQDGSAAIENMMIAATSLGLGTVWIGIHPVPPFERSIRKILNLPDKVFPLGMVYVGYPAETPVPRTQYKEIDIYWDNYEVDRKRKKKDRNAKKSI